MSVWVAIVVGAVVVLLVLFLALTYNHLVRLRNEAQTGWANIDVQLRRRFDLVPNLVEAVKGYAEHERELFESITQAAHGRAAGERPGGRPPRRRRARRRD